MPGLHESDDIEGSIWWFPCILFGMRGACQVSCVMCRGMAGSAPSRPDNVPATDFDFEAALSKFNKADVQQQNVRPAARCSLFWCKQD